MAGIPLPLPPVPGQESGVDGEKGHRPHEKKVEARDVIKLLSEATIAGGRISAPKGLLVGGGSVDYAMRGRENFSKDLNHSTPNVSDGSGIRASMSFCRHNVCMLGPLNALSEDKRLGPSPGPYGVPISIEAIHRAKGAFVYQQKAALDIKLDADVEVLIGVTIWLNESDKLKFFLKIAGDPLPLVQRMWVDATVTWYLKPVGFKELAVASYKGISGFVVIESRSFDQSGIELLTDYKDPRILIRNADFLFSDIPDSAQRIWLDCGVTSSETPSSTKSFTLRSSLGTTLAGHDGYPYSQDIASADSG